MKYKPIVVATIALAALTMRGQPSLTGTAANLPNAVPGRQDRSGAPITTSEPAVLGKPVKDGVPHSSQKTKQCQWDAADGPTGGSVAILVYIGGQKASWSSTLTQAKMLPKYSDVQGLGDAAFSNGFDLHILKGDDMYQIGVAGPFKDNVDRATTIAKEALARA
jgi:hypothetical protein